MNNRNNRRARIRKTIKGDQKRPRLVVFRSHRYLYAQLIDDAKGQTLVSIDKSQSPEEAGRQLGEKALKAKIKEAVFDRAGYKYHGNLKKFADAVRATGIKF